MNIDRLTKIETCLRNYAANNPCWDVDMHNWNCCALGIVIKEKVFEGINESAVFCTEDVSEFLDISMDNFHHLFGSPRFGEYSTGRAALLERADRVHRLINSYVTVEKLKEKCLEELEV